MTRVTITITIDDDEPSVDVADDEDTVTPTAIEAFQDDAPSELPRSYTNGPILRGQRYTIKTLSRQNGISAPGDLESWTNEEGRRYIDALTAAGKMAVVPGSVSQRRAAQAHTIQPENENDFTTELPEI